MPWVVVILGRRHESKQKAGLDVLESVVRHICIAEQSAIVAARVTFCASAAAASGRSGIFVSD
jgi:hypothetical protein